METKLGLNKDSILRELIMNVRDAQLLMKSFNALVEQLNLPFYIAENFCENDVKEAVLTTFANLIREVDEI